jgi:hypothetical protein
MPAAASSASPLLTAISNPKRSAALEVHVALLLLLGLLLARPGSSAAADGGLPHTAPPVAADDVEPDSLHAPMHREQLRSLQRDLATCLCARGLPQALYACAQRLYDAFKALAPVEGGDGIGAGGAGGGSGNGLLTVKETAPEMRTLAPFFTDEYAKAHVDPFVECHRLALDAILRLAQRLHLPGGRIPPAAAPTAAAPVPFAPAAAFGAATAVSGTAASVSTAASAIAAASATAAATMEGSAESEGEQLLSRWLVLLCHVGGHAAVGRAHGLVPTRYDVHALGGIAGLPAGLLGAPRLAWHFGGALGQAALLLFAWAAMALTPPTPGTHASRTCARNDSFTSTGSTLRVAAIQAAPRCGSL